MFDELEDLESMQRRIRDNARRRREELRQRRVRREATRRRRRSSNASSSSSCSSHDLLASSSSPSSSRSPSPSPPSNNDAADGTSSTRIYARKIPLAVAEETSCTLPAPTTESCACGGGAKAKAQKICLDSQRKPRPSSTEAEAEVNKQNKLTKMNLNLLDDDSDSDSDFDFAEMSRRLAERNKMRESANENNNHNNKNNNNTKDKRKTLKQSHLWSSDDDSGDLVNIRKNIARKAAEKRKRESTVALSSSKRAGTPSPKAKDEFDCTPKTNNFMSADAKTNKPRQDGHDPQSDKSTSGLTFSNNDTIIQNGKRSAKSTDAVPSKQQSQLQPPLLKENARSRIGDHGNSTLSAGTTKELQKSPCAQEGKQYATGERIQATAKPSIASKIVLDNSTCSKPSSQKASRQDTTPSAKCNTDPIIGKEVRTRSNVDWTVQKQCLLVRTVGSCSPKGKVAGFDLDQTLANWRCSGWPSRPEHYELWSSAVVDKLRQLHDDGYKLVIFSNQGGIKSAFHGKKAGTVKGVIDWITKLVARPLYAVCSTKKNGGYHKGDPGMWNIMEDYCNCGKEVRPDLSFYVGDADGIGDDRADAQRQQHQQSGTDKLFAANVGKMRSAKMKFYTPGQYFGPSNVERRRTSMTSVEAPPPPIPKKATRVHAALLGGYLSGPILLILVGVQGSGKSTFSDFLANSSGSNWCQFSQDSIRNGKPGTLQAVEKAAREAIGKGKSVVIDRMHLDAEQRSHFLELGEQCQVPVHGLVMMASKEEVEDRVKHRVNHPGKVEGVNGSRIAVASLSKLVPPMYEEGFALITYSRQMEGKLWDAYQRVGRKEGHEVHVPKTIELYNGGTMAFPMITLGTMNMRKQATATITSQALQMGLASVDTAPTYNNEIEVGAGMKNSDNVTVTIKVPKRATSPEQAREEVMRSLSQLQRSQADLILLHWPCAEDDTLSSIWKEMEAMKKEDLCRNIGVSNFNINALQKLLSFCSIKPALNQVERHPLLPQHELCMYCMSQDIVIQAHTPLGNGNELLLGNDNIVRVAQESNMSPAQTLLCWNLQHGVPVVTKCSSENHMKELLALLQEKSKFGLCSQQMKMIDCLDFSGKSHRLVAPPFMYQRGAAYSWG